MRARLDHYKRIIALSAGGALLVAALLAFWCNRQDIGTPPSVMQSAQIDDLRVSFQLDQLVLGARVADIVIDGASSAAMVSGVRLRFSMPAMDMGVIEADAQPLRDGHFRAKGQFFTMAMGRQRSGFDPAQAIFPSTCHPASILTGRSTCGSATATRNRRCQPGSSD